MTPASSSPTTDAARPAAQVACSVSLIATRCARSAGDPADARGACRRGGRRRSPMIAVIGAARPAPPAGDPLGHVEHGGDARLVVGEVDDHDPLTRAGTG